MEVEDIVSVVLILQARLSVPSRVFPASEHCVTLLLLSVFRFVVCLHFGETKLQNSDVVISNTN